MPQQDTILIIADNSPQAFECAKRHYAEEPLAVLNLDPQAEPSALPKDWRRIASNDLIDTDALRQEFLAFLDAWPRQCVWKGNTFDQLFRRPDGYSVWWTGPGIMRHPDTGVFPKLKSLWIAARAIRRDAPKRVLVFTQQPDLAHALGSVCAAEQYPCEFLPGSADDTFDPWSGRLRWVCAALMWMIAWPVCVIIRAILARRFARLPREAKPLRHAPAVVYASQLFPYSRIDRGRVSLCFWKDLHEALLEAAPGMEYRYLPAIPLPGRFRGYRSLAYVCHTGWRLLRQLHHAVPIKERYVAFGAQLRTAPRHLAALIRYWRLERTPAFRSSFTFAGADVAGLYAPLLRRTFTRFGVWDQAVGAITQSIRAAGDVRVMLITEEMYESGMQHIAAANRLGITTVGIQHGTVFPMHMIYTLPPGQLEGSPAPDYLAVHGEFAKQTVCEHGAFPADRVWITGGLQLDGLAGNRPDTSAARRSLGLPQEKRIVLLASQKFPWFPQAVEAVLEAIKDDKDCLVCVKTHPRDVPMDVYRGIARQIGATNVKFFDDNVNELLTACDLLISGSSTTVLEAILLGRKAICVNFSDEPDRYPYVADGGALGAGSVEEIRAALDRLFSAEHQPELEVQRQHFLQRHAGPAVESRSAKTLAERVISLCLDSSPHKGSSAACA